MVLLTVTLFAQRFEELWAVHVFGKGSNDTKQNNHWDDPNRKLGLVSERVLRVNRMSVITSALIVGVVPISIVVSLTILQRSVPRPVILHSWRLVILIQWGVRVTVVRVEILVIIGGWLFDITVGVCEGRVGFVETPTLGGLALVLIIANNPRSFLLLQASPLLLELNC